MRNRHLRLRALTLALGMTATGIVTAQDCSGTITADEALKAEASRYVAQTTGDYAAMDRLFGNDLTYNHSSAATDNKASYIDLMRSGRAKYRKINLNDDTKARTYGCVAIITGTAVYDVTVGGQDLSLPLRYTTVWAKRPAGLEFVSWQSTSLPAKK